MLQAVTRALTGVELDYRALAPISPGRGHAPRSNGATTSTASASSTTWCSASWCCARIPADVAAARRRVRRRARRRRRLRARRPPLRAGRVRPRVGRPAPQRLRRAHWDDDEARARCTRRTRSSKTRSTPPAPDPELEARWAAFGELAAGHARAARSGRCTRAAASSSPGTRTAHPRSSPSTTSCTCSPTTAPTSRASSRSSRSSAAPTPTRRASPGWRP